MADEHNNDIQQGRLLDTREAGEKTKDIEMCAGAVDDVVNAFLTASVSVERQGNHNKRKRSIPTPLANPHQLRKNPHAPKRFKSSYICFFIAKQAGIKQELGESATVAEISRQSAILWKRLSETERKHWEEMATKDKERYNIEKATYTGPWQVSTKRAKKDPSAPKRPMSAFLYFAQEHRSQIKHAHPDTKNTDISKQLGEMWRSLTEAVRKPYIDQERTAREQYKIDINEWRKEHEAKVTEERERAHVGMGHVYPTQFGYAAEHPYGVMPVHAYAGVHSPYGRPMPTPYGYSAPSYNTFHAPPRLGPIQFNQGGAGGSNKPIVLGPNGMPAVQGGHYGAHSDLAANHGHLHIHHQHHFHNDLSRGEADAPPSPEPSEHEYDQEDDGDGEQDDHHSSEEEADNALTYNFVRGTDLTEPALL
ncbi:hypothetical protein MPSEU_000532800 [Mayamaea pseudoterrestris]|nr:hypothetical protein MPSEU_000532800 [Mayamaea pseudoterrestris]